MPMTAKLVDITTLTVDAIVNAANEDLLPGGGVSGAIHAAAGPELTEACQRIGYCPTGDAKITSAFNLPCRFVVHAVGPVWEGGDADEPQLLASAVRKALSLAHNHRSESVAVPAISTGVYRYPLDEAVDVIVAATREALDAGSCPPDVVFACISEDALAAFERALAADAARELPAAS
jgi:O-acetyl-ADP-ribose deacetylase